MRRTCKLLSIILWVVLVVAFIIMGVKDGWQSVTPIITYNRPQGIFGWAVIILLFLSATDFSVNHLSHFKK